LAICADEMTVPLPHLPTLGVGDNSTAIVLAETILLLSKITRPLRGQKRTALAAPD
jgi:hypothetical protein